MIESLACVQSAACLGLLPIKQAGKQEGRKEGRQAGRQQAQADREAGSREGRQEGRKTGREASTGQAERRELKCGVRCARSQ